MKTVMIAAKPGADARPLVDLLYEYVPTPCHVALVSLVRVGDGEEMGRLEEAKTYLSGLASELEGKGYEVTPDASVVVPASEGFQLVQKATEHQVDLAIFGLGHRGRVGKAVMGSDAQRLLLGLSCPVLAVRPPS